MITPLSNELLQVFMSLFKGRQDVFAIRWERESRNGSEYIIKKKLGKNTFGTEAYYRMLEERDGYVFIPRGFVRELLLYCKEKRIPYQLNDERKKLRAIKYSFKGSLYDYQKAAIDTAVKKEMGVIVAPPGSGKTIIGLSTRRICFCL